MTHADDLAAIDLAAIDLAALVVSRVCHDVIAPVGAVNNGIEVLEVDDNPEMREFALDLIRKSAKQASAKLQFVRLAFGASRAAGSDIDLGDAEAVAKGYMEGEKAELVWRAPRIFLPKNQVKLLLNLLLVAITTIPRGGTIEVDLAEAEPGLVLTLACTGINARIPPNVETLIAGQLGADQVDPLVIQPIYAGLLARAAGMNVAFAKDGDIVTITARPVV